MTGSQHGRRFQPWGGGVPLLARATVRAALLVAVLFVPAAAQVATTAATNSTNGVWFADAKILKQIDSVTHELAQQISLERKPEAVAVDPNDQALWVLTRKRLLKFDALTNPILDIEVRDLTEDSDNIHKHKKKKLDGSELLALNPYDQSVWVARDALVVHLNAQGELLQTVEVPERIGGIALSLDETLWVVGKRRLWQVLPDGTVTEPINLPELIDQLKEDHPDDHQHAHQRGKPKRGRLVAIDALRGILWLANQRHLARINLNDVDDAIIIYHAEASENGKKIRNITYTRNTYTSTILPP